MSFDNRQDKRKTQHSQDCEGGNGMITESIIDDDVSKRVEASWGSSSSIESSGKSI